MKEDYSRPVRIISREIINSVRLVGGDNTFFDDLTHSFVL